MHQIKLAIKMINKNNKTYQSNKTKQNSKTNYSLSKYILL